MVISDLQHLESVEATSIVGGSRRRGGSGNYNFAQVIQVNVALFNKDDVYQSNSAYISQR